jgi:hypothetical protein
MQTDMWLSRQINIDLRLLSVAIAVLMSFWYISVWLGLHAGKGFVSNLNLFWSLVYVGAPFVAIVLAIILLYSHYSSGERFKWWVYPAALFAFSPWLLGVLGILIAFVFSLFGSAL